MLRVWLWMSSDLSCLVSVRFCWTTFQATESIEEHFPCVISQERSTRLLDSILANGRRDDLTADECWCCNL